MPQDQNPDPIRGFLVDKVVREALDRGSPPIASLAQRMEVARVGQGLPDRSREGVIKAVCKDLSGFFLIVAIDPAHVFLNGPVEDDFTHPLTPERLLEFFHRHAHRGVTVEFLRPPLHLGEALFVIVHQLLDFQEDIPRNEGGLGFPIFSDDGLVSDVHDGKLAFGVVVFNLDDSGGVGPCVNLLQVRDGDLGVDAGGVEPGVAEELLHDADVGAVFVHVGRAAVAQKVATSGLFDPGRFDRFGDPVAEVSGADPLAVSAEEEGWFADFEDKLWAAFLEVVFQPVERRFADGKEAVFASFSFADEEGLAAGIEVAEVELGEFASPGTGGVEGFQNGAVPDAERVADVGQGHKVCEFFFAESFGQAALLFAREFQVGGGVGREVVVFAEVGKEALDGSKARALGSVGERLAVGLAVAEEPTLEAFEDGLGDLFRTGEVALLRPGEEGFQGPLVGVEGAV